MDKYGCALKNNGNAGHLPKGKIRNLRKQSIFLRADQYSYCHAVVKVKYVNLGDVDGMQAPCTLMIERSKLLIVRLQEQLSLIQ